MTTPDDTVAEGRVDPREAVPEALVQERLAALALVAKLDNPLAARDALRLAVEAGDIPADLAVPLRAQLDERLAHMDSKDAYRAFYDLPTPERTFMTLEAVPHAHLIHPRWGEIRRQLEQQDAKRILELACFDAWTILNYAVAHPGVQCLGVDLAQHAVAEANARAARFRVPLQVIPGFLEETQAGRQFDAVLLLEILEHVPNVEAALVAAERHLVSGGRVYVSAPLTAPPHTGAREMREHVRLFDHATMLSLLSSRGRLVWYAQLKLPDGLHHMGAYEP